MSSVLAFGCRSTMHICTMVVLLDFKRLRVSYGTRISLFGNRVVTFPSVVDTKFSAAAAMALNGFGVTMSTFVRNRARLHNLIVFTEFSLRPHVLCSDYTRWASSKIFQNFFVLFLLSLFRRYTRPFPILISHPTYPKSDLPIDWPQINFISLLVYTNTFY